MIPKVLKGSYGATCRLHPGEQWDLTLGDPTDRSVELELNESFSNCPLTITMLQMQVGTTLIDYPLAQPILAQQLLCRQIPVALSASGGGSVSLFVNAKFGGLGSTMYSNNFSIEMVYSDNALACSVTAPAAIYATASAVVYGTFGSPPNYVMSFDDLHLSVDKDLIVQSSSGGFVKLALPTLQPQAGEQWRVFDESARCCRTYSYAAIDTIYRNVTPVASGDDHRQWRCESVLCRFRAAGTAPSENKNCHCETQRWRGTHLLRTVSGVISWAPVARDCFSY